MSSLNVRFAQKTRRKTDLWKCTNLPSNDSYCLNPPSRRGPHWDSNSRANAQKKKQRVCALAAFLGTRLKESKRASKRTVQAGTGGEKPQTMKRSLRYEMKTSLQWESRAGRSDTNSEGHYLCPRAWQTSYATSLAYVLQPHTHINNIHTH